MTYSDVVVVGGGPSGLSASWGAASHGVDVMLLEEHEEIGRPRHCTGLVSGEGLKIIGMPCKGDYIENKVWRAIIIVGNRAVELRKLGEPVYVLNREKFDKAMADRAADSGAVILTGDRVKRIHVSEGMFTVKTTKTSYSCRVVIDGEGASSKLARSMGLDGPKLRIPALQVEVYGEATLCDEVLVIVGDQWAPGFFAWVVPTGDDRLRVGLASTIGRRNNLLTNFIKRHPLISGLLRNHQIKEMYGGLIAIGPPDRTHSGNFMIVGDAAGQTKPLTGGGVVYGSLCGFLAGMTASKIIDGRAEATLYERTWRRLLSLEEELGVPLRKFLVGEDSVEMLLGLLSRTNVLSYIERNAHYESHVASIIKKPGVLLLSSLIFVFVASIKAFKYFLEVLLPKRGRK
ncbi:MAG: NAD(P)/FAD-dependent oxidoreductase [Candidatus Nezhaarchaeales archaeon]